MPLLLPIGGRRASAEDSTTSRRSSSLITTMTPSASPASFASETECSSADGLKLAVKNTFIDVDVEALECDEKRELPLHQLGAQTCTARLSQIGRFPDAIRAESQIGEEVSTDAEDSELSEIENTANTCSSHALCTEATPDAQSMRGLLAAPPADVFNMPPPFEAPEPEPQARQMMIQVPLEVAAGSPQSTSDLQVAVLSSSSESLGSCTVVDLRVLVGPSGDLQVLRSPAGQVLLSAALGSRAPSTASDFGSVPPSPVPSAAAPAEDAPGEVPMPPVLRKALRAKTAPTAKSNMVCCHWKNKGWCKYQDGCRFLHPEHKRGVGLNSCKGAAAAGTPSGRSPGGLSADGRCHLQQPGSGGAQAGGLAAGMWAMPPEWAGCAFVQQFSP